MILRSWIIDNCKGNVIGVRFKSHSTGFVFLTDNPDLILTKDLDVEAITKEID